MGTILASAVIDKAQIILNDTAGVRETDVQLLGWLNDGQREIVVFKPNAYVKNEAVKLVAGTKQSIPADGIMPVDVTRNMGADGATPGRAIRLTNRETLDANTPYWHAATPSATVRHFIYSVLDPKHFYVYPPQPATGQGYVELVYGAIPAAVTSGEAISVDDIYQNALVDYIVYRALSKDSEFAGNVQSAALHQQAYISALTGKASGEAAASPNNAAPAAPTGAK